MIYIWLRSHRRPLPTMIYIYYIWLSATNHDLQGLDGDRMTVIITSLDLLKARRAKVCTDISTEDKVQPSVYQIISIDGQAKEIIMMNDGLYQS
jgi:hypothetical protein